MARGGPDIVPILTRLVRDRKMPRRLQAVRALGLIADARAVRDLTILVSDNSEEEAIRLEAFEGLRGMDPEAARRLAREMSGDPALGETCEACLRRRERSRE